MKTIRRRPTLTSRARLSHNRKEAAIAKLHIFPIFRRCSKPETNTKRPERRTRPPRSTNKIAALSAANNAANDANAAYGLKLDVRDELLYAGKTGICDRMDLVKTYVALTFGKDGSTYRQINALEFKKR